MINETFYTAFHIGDWISVLYEFSTIILLFFILVKSLYGVSRGDSLRFPGRFTGLRDSHVSLLNFISSNNSKKNREELQWPTGPLTRLSPARPIR